MVLFRFTLEQSAKIIDDGDDDGSGGDIDYGNGNGTAKKLENKLGAMTEQQLLERWSYLDDDDTGNDEPERPPSIAFDQEDWRRQEQENRRCEQIFQARWQLQGMEQRGIKTN